MYSAADERAALAHTLAGSDLHGPTLCEGWDVLDLAAHLVSRERQPVSSLGLVSPALGFLTDRARRREASRGLAAVVERFRRGPVPVLGTLPAAVEDRANLAEFVVHHEDVRRAAGLPPREGVPGLQQAVWRMLPGFALMVLAKRRIPVVAVRPDGRRRVLWRGPDPVVLRGEPVEIMLAVAGREPAEVEWGGSSLQVARFRRPVAAL